MSGDDAAPALPLRVIERVAALEEAHGWLSADALRALAREEGVSPHALEGFVLAAARSRRAPPARATIEVCRDAACGLRGAAALAEACRRRVATTTDVEVVEVPCLGRCDAAPAAAVNGAPVGEATASLLDAVAAGRAPPPPVVLAPPGRRLASDPYAAADARYGVLRGLVAAGTAASRGAPEVLLAAGLAGRGGAGEPAGAAWARVRDAAGDARHVICRADASAPGRFRDRALLGEAPHLVLEGVLVACAAVGARHALVCVRREHRAERAAFARELERATRAGALAAAGVASCAIFTSPGGFVLGDPTALLEALAGRRAEPRDAPFDATRGLDGRPTLLDDAATFARVPRVLDEGADAWRARGRRGAPGLAFVALCGDVARPGLHEVPAGTTVRELIDVHGGGVRDGRRLDGFARDAVSLAPGSDADATVLDGDDAVLALAEGRDVVSVAASLVRHYRDEACGKCAPCRVGVAKAAAILARRLAGEDVADELRALPTLHATIEGASACALGKIALRPALDVLARFPTRASRAAKRD